MKMENRTAMANGLRSNYMDNGRKYDRGDILLTKDGFKVRVVDYGWDEDLTLWYECEPVEFTSFSREFKEEDLCRV